MKDSDGGILVWPLLKKTLTHAGACIGFIRERTDLPAARASAEWDDESVYHLMTEAVPGTKMTELDLIEERSAMAMKELGRRRSTMRTLLSKRLGGSSGHVGLEHSPFDIAILSEGEFFVDPGTLSIITIPHWEHAGFWLEWFKEAIWTPGDRPSIADECDKVRVLGITKSRVDSVESHEVTYFLTSAPQQQRLHSSSPHPNPHPPLPISPPYHSLFQS